MNRQNTGNHPEPPQPRVWVVYRDHRKDMTKANKFGQLTDMFAGQVNYPRAVEQARKMLESYKDGDYIMMVGDPALCLIVGAVALEYAEDDTLRLLRWNRDEVEYQTVEHYFGEPDPLDIPALPEAVVTKNNRYGDR